MKLNLGHDRTHMPYVAEIGGDVVLAFCVGTLREGLTPTQRKPYTYMQWLPWIQVNDAPPAPVEMPDGAMVCNPVVQSNDETMTILYSMAFPFARFTIFERKGQDSTAHVPGAAAFRRNGLWVLDNGVLQGDQRMSLDGIKINRAVPWGEKTLLTGKDAAGAWRSFAVDPSGELTEILVNGQPVYKCSIHNGSCYHAVRVGGFEDREIHSDPFEEVKVNDPAIRLSFS